MFLRTAVTAGLSAIIMTAPAQDSSRNELDPVTVTASLSPVRASQTGRNLMVLEGSLFYQMPVQSVDELLRYIPGIEVQARGPMGAQSDIVIRGGTFQQVLVILDGIRLNDPLTGHFNSYIPIAPAEIERIEVLKGAASAIYGTEAVGGVVHIITKSFGAAKKTGAQAQLTGGAYGLANVSGGGLWKTKTGSWGGGLQHNRSDGQAQRGTTGFFNNSTASLSFREKISGKWTVGARSAYDRRDFSAQNFYTTFLSDTAREKVTTFWNHVQAAYAGAKFQLKMDAGFKQVSDRYQYNRRSAPNENQSSVLQWQSVVQYILSAKSSFTGGLQLQEKAIRSNDRGNHRRRQAGIFGIWRWQAGSAWHGETALRTEFLPAGRLEWLPQVNLSFRQEKYQLRASAGRTIRDADFTERYNNYNKPFVSGGSIGNPSLGPESAFNWEAGADIWVKPYFKIAVTAFNRNQRDLIDYVITPYADMPRKDNLNPSGSFALARNLARVQTAGAEADIQYRKTFTSGKWLMIQTGMVWLNSNSNGATPGFYLSSHARWLTNWSVSYRMKRFQLAVNGVYKVRNARQAPSINAAVSPSYMVANLRMDVFVNSRLGCFMQADNITNTSYSDILGAVMPGRWLMGGIKWQITTQ